MASFSAPCISRLPSPSQTSFFSTANSNSPLLIPSRRSSFSTITAAAATAAYAETGTESGTASFSSRFNWPPKSASPSPASYYDVLEIPFGATGDEIKAAYRKLARAFHPDVAGTAEKESSANAFIKIHSAYSTLSDPEKRADYDRRLFSRWRSVEMRSGICSSPSPARSSGFTSSTRRNWETDQCW